MFEQEESRSGEQARSCAQQGEGFSGFYAFSFVSQLGGRTWNIMAWNAEENINVLHW